ncbi:2-oxo-4-hydroxy-4-carboxy-5-ureidoimidazoline decarboxylase [Zhihengliuella sp.]|uniref:2-oxo-4-hydroxy-4-carboxy-5-ureidoimidazoline decarboxylase n=1 Tax=Zhihengliuella sp. TaxID=1954483 RepID=UPI0028117893|nr:2-oxo-4-hydroxy-4-carboxy-5-ureidoimidazoline decarboxylase [Zhihengliuella sp.]
MDLEVFNSTDPETARAALRPCIDVDRWVDELEAGRPYASVDELLARAATAALPFTAGEVEQALSHHPRIGERADGETAEAKLSRGEQAAVDPASETTRRIHEGNRAYEERFGHVFLIRAAGRSPEEILAELQRRLENSAEQEERETAEQLRQIALLRLRGAVDAPAAAPAAHS